MPLELLNKADSPPPVVRKEFEAEFDAERARRLRVRLMWYCGFIYALMALSIFGSWEDVARPNNTLHDWMQIGQDLAGDIIGLCAASALLLYCVKRGRTRAQLVRMFTLLAILVGIAMIVLVPLTDNSASPITTATLAPTAEAAIGQQWVILISLLLIQLPAALLVALTPRENFRIIVPLAVAYALEAFVHPHLPTVAAILFVVIGLILAMPGLVWSWWRYRRFQETFHGTVLSKRYEEISSELDHARKVHEALFPPPVTRGGLKMAYRYEPMRQIGGDFLYAHPLSFPPTAERQRLSVLVMDVTGHGVSAALAVNRLYVELTRIFTSGEHPSPEKAICELNTFAFNTLAPQGMFATAICLRVEMEGGVAKHVAWCSAGHPPAILRRASGALERLGPSAPMLGVLDSESYTATVEQRELSAGDTVVAYTDGAMEAASAEGRDFGIEGIEGAMGSWQGPVVSGQVAADVLKRVTAHRAGPTKDDILVVELLSTGVAES
ncbi:MAG: PP2C family protein-serine/threonine phosphatase [Phycisphaerales bacterium]